MSDFSNGWRPSVNVQTQPLDALRRNWLDEAAYAPDAYRAQWGLSPLSGQTRSAVLQVYAPEQPYYAPGTDYFGQGRPQKVDAATPLAALGAPSFRKQAEDAAFAAQIGNPLRGQSSGPDDIYDTLQTAAGIQPLTQLGVLARYR